VGLVPVTDNGIRSLQLQGHLLSAGTGDANLVFFDLRHLRRERGPRLRDIGPAVGGGGEHPGRAGRSAGRGFWRPPHLLLAPLLPQPRAQPSSGRAHLGPPRPPSRPQDDPFDAVRGFQPLELGHLEMPTSANNIQDQW
jgi:hypothetical protein